MGRKGIEEEGEEMERGEKWGEGAAGVDGLEWGEGYGQGER